MLFHQPSIQSPDKTQRHHRRQNSTPSGFEAQGIPIFPATNQHSGFHHRGMSMNSQPAVQFKPPHPQQEGHLVSITNTGNHQQQHLQEAQQQPQARPGQQQANLQHIQLSEQEFRNLQHQQLDAQIDSLLRNQQPHSFKNNDASRVVKVERSHSQPGTSNHVDFTMSPQAQLVMSPQILSHYDIAYGMPCDGPVAGVVHPGGERGEPELVLHPNWMLHQQRPFTPPDQIVSGHHPLTPHASPYLALHNSPDHSERMSRNGSQQNDSSSTIRARICPTKQQSGPSNTSLEQADYSPERHDPNRTIKARSRPCHLRGLSQASLPKSDHDSLPSPPNTAPMDASFDPSPQMSIGMHFDLFPGDHDVYGQQAPSIHESLQNSPNRSSSKSPVSAGQFLQNGPTLFPAQTYSGASSPSHTARSSIDFGVLDSHTELPDSPSIADLSLDATIEETGISAEEVQAYISQPDPDSGKWTCLYPECGKTFGRKENVRAHVQTHLGDRQFKCIHCGKCFVRQHDLKRHSKTHSGVKPYPCQCGNSFARHDALTRHRQRGICTGGFEGIVKKVAKRGRPRKERPSHDDRADKAARSRKRAAAKSYASSVSGTSDSSFPESPPALMSAFDFEASEAQLLAELTSSSPLTLAPDSLNFTFPPSPSNSDPTNKAESLTSGRSPQNVPFEQENDTTQLRKIQGTDSVQRPAESNVGSQAGSPPDLSPSSPPSSTRFLDFDFGSTFNSSGSDPSEGLKQDSTSINFEGVSFLNSPAHVSTPWNENSFFNFDKDITINTGDAFATSFDDDILFSDNCERGSPFF